MAMLSTILRTKLLAALFLAIGIAAVGLSANPKNYCWKTNTFNSTAITMQLAVENLIPKITVLKVDSSGTTIADAVESGRYPNIWTELISYPSFERFMALNPDCCRISPQDDFGVFQPTWVEYLTGWRYGVEITWRRMYLDDAGVVRPFRDPNATSKRDRSFEGKRFLVSSCGETRWFRPDSGR